MKNQPVWPSTPRAPRGGPLDTELLALVPELRFSIAVAGALGLVSTATLVVQAIALARLVASTMPHAVPTDRPADFVALLVAVAVRAALVRANGVVAQRGASRTKAVLRERLVTAAIAQGSPAGAGEAASTATLAGYGIDALDAYYERCLPDVVIATCAPIALAIAIGVLDWMSLLVVLVVLALFPVFGVLVGRRSGELAEARWREVELLGRRIADVFAGLPILRAYDRSKEQRARIAQSSASLATASLATLRVAFLSGLVLDTLASISVALIAVPLGLRLLNGSISLARALAVLIIAPEVFVPFRRASANFHESSEGLAAQRAALDQIAAVGLDAPAGSRTPPDPATHPIGFNGVRIVAAGRAQPILTDANLEIEPGEVVALIGPNGCGKSTAIAALLGFVRPQTGSITVGGENLRDLDLARWRQQVAYLPDRPNILPMTLAENLRLANPAARDEDLLAALAAAGAAELVTQLGDGLSSYLDGDRARLSAGERQRVALARILCRPARLYLLDEPTVHLDPDTEASVVESLRVALRGASALIVTHRRAPLTLAHRILTIKEGRFVPAPARLQEDVAVFEGVLG